MYDFMIQCHNDTNIAFTFEHFSTFFSGSKLWVRTLVSRSQTRLWSKDQYLLQALKGLFDARELSIHKDPGNLLACAKKKHFLLRQLCTAESIRGTHRHCVVTHGQTCWGKPPSFPHHRLPITLKWASHMTHDSTSCPLWHWPVIDVPKRLFKFAQNFRRCGPLYVLAVVLHVTDVFEASVDLADVRFNLVTPVSPDDDEGGAHAAVTHSGQRPTPYLCKRVRTTKD